MLGLHSLPELDEIGITLCKMLVDGYQGQRLGALLTYSMFTYEPRLERPEFGCESGLRIYLVPKDVNGK